jgi:hypothetical protein
MWRWYVASATAGGFKRVAGNDSRNSLLRPDAPDVLGDWGCRRLWHVRVSILWSCRLWHLRAHLVAGYLRMTAERRRAKLRNSSAIWCAVCECAAESSMQTVRCFDDIVLGGVISMVGGGEWWWW